ncbi:MAG: DUF2752 domain-containing protein [Lachnospiraceae bacterium]|nr:DUF2752 domain-containing protein [Lachnospiraceae bacterium]
MFRPEREETEKTLFYIGLAAAGVFAAAAGLSRAAGMSEEWRAFFFACPIYVKTGYYCFGCGGTRAFTAFFSGHFGKSFLYHPAVFWGLSYFLLFMGSRVLNVLSRGRTPNVRFRTIYVFIGIFLLLVNFFVKNWLHFRTGIDILGMI